MTARRIDGPAVHTAALTKSFGGRVSLHDLDVDVPAGSITGLVGRRGSGKSTTLRILLGLLTPTSGSATVLGEPLTHKDRYLPRVGAMVDGPAFHFRLSGRQNLRVLAAAGRLASYRVDEVLAAVGLTRRADDPVRSYSVGMRQRLGIAAALLPEPDLVVLDEPTDGLDPDGLRDVRNLIQEIGDGGTTVLVTAEQLAELEPICDHVIAMHQGSARYQGPMADLVIARGGGLLAAAERYEDQPWILLHAMACGYDATTDGGTVRVAAPPAWAAELNRAAHRAGITLVRLEPLASPMADDAVTHLEATAPRLTSVGYAA
jgi:ABC-2 type transport system ATP-binding protein